MYDPKLLTSKTLIIKKMISLYKVSLDLIYNKILAMFITLNKTTLHHIKSGKKIKKKKRKKKVLT